MKKLIGLIIMVSSMLTSIGQQMPESNLYSLNEFSLNPAYAGFNECLEAHISNLSQWTGFEGAPGTSYFSVNSGMPNLSPKMGVGGQIVMDRTDMINRFSAVASYSYKLALGNKHYLRLGLSAGMYQVKANATNATVLDNNDAVVINGVNRGTTFSSEFGFLYNHKKIEFGIAVPEIFQRNIDFNISGLSSEYYLKRNLQLYGSYKQAISDVISIKPNILFKTVGNGLNQLDINVIGTYNDIISLGLGYRTNSGIMSQLHINIKDMYYLGYSYAIPGAGITSYASGSHEIMLGIKICKDKTSGRSSMSSTNETVSFEPANEEIVEEPVEEPSEEEVPNEVIEEEVITEEITGTKEEIISEVQPEKEVTKDKLFEENYKPQILFPFDDGDNFDLSDNNDLKELTKYLNKNKDKKVTLIGHACDLGDSSKNMNISANRAKSVYNALVKMGVRPSQLTTKAKGESAPLFPNNSEENRRKNRRVEIKFD